MSYVLESAEGLVKLIKGVDGVVITYLRDFSIKVMKRSERGKEEDLAAFGLLFSGDGARYFWFRRDDGYIVYSGAELSKFKKYVNVFLHESISYERRRLIDYGRS